MGKAMSASALDENAIEDGFWPYRLYCDEGGLGIRIRLRVGDECSGSGIEDHSCSQVRHDEGNVVRELRADIVEEQAPPLKRGGGTRGRNFESKSEALAANAISSTCIAKARRVAVFERKRRWSVLQHTVSCDTTRVSLSAAIEAFQDAAAASAASETCKSGRTGSAQVRWVADGDTRITEAEGMAPG